MMRGAASEENPIAKKMMMRNNETINFNIVIPSFFDLMKPPLNFIYLYIPRGFLIDNIY